jgi:hypothetical protein
VRATRIWACLARHFDHVLIIPAGVYEPGSDICWTFFLSANHSIPSFRASRNKISCCAEVATLKSSWRAFILLSVDHHSCFLPPTPVSSSCLFHKAFHLFHYASVHSLAFWSKRVPGVCSMYPQTPSGFAGQMPYGQATPGRQGGELDEYYEALPPQWSCVETVGQSSVTSVRCFS